MTEEEFDQFIKEYPEPLGVGSINVGVDMITFHDHSYGRFPNDNLIAFKTKDCDNMEYHIYPFKEEV